MKDLQGANELCFLLSDATRVRLLALLEEEALTVAELTEILGVAQSRVSTHLARLKEAGFITVEKVGASSLVRVETARLPRGAERLWRVVREESSEALFQADRARARELVLGRNGTRSWAESVAGNMERHYSPGRTFEATLHGLLGFVELGDVLDLGSGDGVVAELIAARARSVTCLDLSPAVVEAGRKRLGATPGVRFVQGDMHALPFDAGAFDDILALSALPYAERPLDVLAELGRVLRPGGRLVLTTLLAHEHRTLVTQYDHKNLGSTEEELRAALRRLGFDVHHAAVSVKEKRPPYFQIISVYARKRAEVRDAV